MTPDGLGDNFGVSCALRSRVVLFRDSTVTTRTPVPSGPPVFLRCGVGDTSVGSPLGAGERVRGLYVVLGW